MPEYLAPGVYIEERPGQRTIEGVSTSTAALVGMTERGPTVGPPILVTSFGDYQQQFGSYTPIQPDASPENGEHGHLALAVKQFFDNGGKRAFIARVYKPTTSVAQGTVTNGVQPSDANLRQASFSTGVTARLRATAPSGIDHAFLASPRGFVPGTSRLLRDASVGAPTVNIDRMVYGTNEAHLVANLGEDYRSDTAFAEMTAALGVNSGPKLVAREPGVWAERIAVDVRPYSAPPVAITGALAAAAAGTTLTISVTSAASFYRGCTIQIAHVPATGNTQGQLLDVHYGTVTAIAGNVLSVLVPNGGFPAYATPAETWVALAEVEILISFGTTFERFRGTWRFLDPANPPAGWTAPESDLFNAAHSVWFELHQQSSLVRLDTGVPVPDVPPFSAIPAAAVYAVTDPLASHPATPDGHPIWLGPETSVPALPRATPDAVPGFVEYVGNVGAGPGARSGIASLLDEETIALVSVPGVSDPKITAALITHAENAKYRFAVLDPPRLGSGGALSIAGVRAHRGHFDSEYAALYYPWIEITDPVSGDSILVPPSGSVLGIYARSDAQRGVHKAPANEVVANVTDVQTKVSFGDQEVINPEGINAIRDFTSHNRGIRVWGARTISSDPEWKYVNVRRLFNFIEHSIDVGTQWVVFEPNNDDLWGRVRRTISVFLEAQWRIGALFGAKAEDSFYVKCDRSTMTLDDIANGRLVVEIGIAPTRPAEFVIFRITQLTADAQTN